MTQGMKKKHILQMGSDKMIPRDVYDKPFMIDSLIEVNGKRGFNPTQKGGTNLVYRWFQDKKKALELGCIAVGQGRNLVLVLGSTQQYSRQKCMPLRHA
jgi:hypothetical protein